jgi:leucyl/phenylalanyl-tRNA--protein transferase
MPVYKLDDNQISFPLPTLARDDGLLAIGGTLSTERLVLAYSNGIFPWYNEGDPILWWCPKERYIIRPENIHVSHSMKKFMRKHDVKVELNRDFSHTMHRCREKREVTEEGTWITTDMERAYAELAGKGLALSVEAYIDGQLAGGL